MQRLGGRGPGSPAKPCAEGHHSGGLRPPGGGGSWRGRAGRTQAAEREALGRSLLPSRARLLSSLRPRGRPEPLVSSPAFFRTPRASAPRHLTPETGAEAQLRTLTSAYGLRAGLLHANVLPPPPPRNKPAQPDARVRRSGNASRCHHPLQPRSPSSPLRARTAESATAGPAPPWISVQEWCPDPFGSFRDLQLVIQGGWMETGIACSAGKSQDGRRKMQRSTVHARMLLPRELPYCFQAPRRARPSPSGPARKSGSSRK